jgi:hypothetical protein
MNSCYSASVNQQRGADGLGARGGATVARGAIAGGRARRQPRAANRIKMPGGQGVPRDVATCRTCMKGSSMPEDDQHLALASYKVPSRAVTVVLTWVCAIVHARGVDDCKLQLCSQHFATGPAQSGPVRLMMDRGQGLVRRLCESITNRYRQSAPRVHPWSSCRPGNCTTETAPVSTTISCRKTDCVKLRHFV